MCDILFVFEIHSITKLTLGLHSKDFEILDACDHCLILSTWTGNDVESSDEQPPGQHLHSAANFDLSSFDLSWSA